MFDTVHSGQLSVRRVDGAVAQPLLQLRMPFNDPIDSLPDGISPNADFIKVGWLSFTFKRVLGALKTPTPL